MQSPAPCCLLIPPTLKVSWMAASAFCARSAHSIRKAPFCRFLPRGSGHGRSPVAAGSNMSSAASGAAPLRLWVDSDAGIDDAQALLCLAAAERSGEVEVVGVSCVAGNVPMPQGLSNLARVRAALNTRWPLYAGSAMPLDGRPREVSTFYGADGLGDVPEAWPHASDLPLSAETAPSGQCAAEAIAAAAAERPGTLQLVAIGPLTNVARALEVDAKLPSNLRELVVMGGTSRGEGNVTAAAEYNWHFDPEAAAAVASSFPDITILPWETAMESPIAWDDLVAWHRDGAESGTSRTAAFFRHILGMFTDDVRSQDDTGWVAGDPLALCCCLYPELITASERRAVCVECQGKVTRGACVVDRRPWSAATQNARIITAVDRAGFEARLKAALSADSHSEP
mmetsp:Transcript_41844/g.105907  ORF Transcript_41844/g.105907 Transcript_41844/m.105907 type:complete len:398 (-) Transcript_41844:48-1241(-)